MKAAEILKLLDAGYSKEEIEKLESAETVTTQEDPETEETPDEPETEETQKESTPDPFNIYKEQLAEINKELLEATKEIQKFNLSARQQPQVQKEDASDILYNNIVANVIPPENREKEK